MQRRAAGRDFFRTVMLGTRADPLRRSRPDDARVGSAYGRRALLQPQQRLCRKMPSYYSLIAKAVAGLDPDAPGESRQALYERASAALLAQLRTINPPFTEAEITRERLALEEAVRKVEGEAAQRARDARVPTFSDLV